MATVANFFGEEIRLESERARHLYTQKGWNTLVRAAGQGTGSRFLEDYIPLRWNKAYAVAQLFYSRGGNRPFYLTGAWVEAAEAGANVQSVASKGDVRVMLRIPLPHAVQPDTIRGFRRITSREEAYARKTFRAALIKGIDASPVTFSGRLNGRARAEVAAGLHESSRDRARSIIFSSRAQSRIIANKQRI